MTDDRRWLPSSLSSSKQAKLAELGDQAEAQSPAALRALTDAHRDLLAEAHATNRFLNLALAGALAERIRTALDAWDDFRPDQRKTLAAAILYFARLDDHDHDLTSPLGLEDDAAVLSAAFVHVGKPDWTVNPEDFDDA